MTGNRVSRFFDYVEIRTKIASLLPFLLGLGYVAFTYHQVNALRTGLFFMSMLCFDMATTALNNYIDTKTNQVALPVSRPAALRILLALLALAAVLGLLLVWQSGPAGLVVLAAGALCFLIGIFYTFGPAPISRMPLGEAFSGFFMGFFIPFLIVTVNAPADSLVFYSLTGGVLSVSLQLPDLIKLGVLTVTPICGIANIMLANNICDVERDVKVNRFTLPYYIGQKNALRLFGALYAAAYASVLVLAVFRILPVYTLAGLLTAPLVWKNVRRFAAKPSKRETFALSVLNLVLTMVPLILAAAIGALV